MRKRSANQRALRYSDRSLILLSLPTLLWYLAFCYLPIPYYINLLQYQDTAAPIMTLKERLKLHAKIYVMEDQDQRPHFHYARLPDHPDFFISLTEPEYFPPVHSPLLEHELDRLLSALAMIDEKSGVSLYRRLLMAWNTQNETQVDEEREMPDYRELKW